MSWDSITSWFKPKPAPAEPADETVGEQPSARYGERLAADARVVDAMQRRAATDSLAATLTTTPVTTLPLVREVEAPPEDWSAETFRVPNDRTFVQILGRAPHRQHFTVHNQSGNGVTVYLFRSREDAARFVNTPVKPTEGRFIAVPDDPANPREGAHAAGIWAAVHPTAANGAVIDVAASVYRGPRD